MTPRSLAWAAAVAVAVLLRLPGLGADPLSPAEASAAWPARALARGEAVPPLEQPPTSALLLGSQVALAWLAGGGGEAAVRLVPALAGSAAVLLPLLLRRRLGERTAFALALVVALAPSWVAWSRTATGTVLSAAAALAVVGLQLAPQASDDAARRSRLLLAAAWGLLVASGPHAWDLALPLLVGGIAFRPRAVASPGARRLEVVCAAVVPALLASTSGLAQWRGPAAVSSGLTEWLASWSAPGLGAPGAVGRWAVAIAPSLALAAIGLLLAARAAPPPWPRRWLSWLAAWIVWGCAMELRGAAGAGGVSPALVVPASLALAAGIGAVAARLRTPAPGAYSLRRRVAAAAAAALVLLLAGGAARRAGGTAAPAAAGVELLRGDVAALVGSLPQGPDAPRRVVEIVAEPFPDPVLGWYLADLEGVRWVRAPSRGAASGEERLALAPDGAEARLTGPTGGLLGVYRIAAAPGARRDG